MQHPFSRTELILGPAPLAVLAASRVAIFGIGGVGSFAVEGLARAGVGRLVLIDHDTICITNLNRQLHATMKTVGRPKVEVMKERILEINPSAAVETHQVFYTPEMGAELVRADYDYIIDAVDTISAKIDLAVRAYALGIPMISCMGTGNKLDPTRFEVEDIYNTTVCPLARVMRHELRKRGVPALKVIYSREEPIKIRINTENDGDTNIDSPVDSAHLEPRRRSVPGSISFVPPVAGFIAAGEAIRHLIGHPGP